MGYAQDLVNQGYGGYAGWGDPEARADFAATGGSGKKTSPSSSPQTSSDGFSAPQTDYAALARQQLELQKQVTQPAIDTLLGLKSGISSAYGEVKSKIADEYDKLLQSVKSQVNTNVSQTFGARGIPLSSGMVGEAITERTRPLEEQYTAQKAAELARQGIDETNKLSGIDQLIASLQSGGGQNAISQAISLYVNQQAIDRAAQDQAWKQRVYQETTLPESQHAIKKPYYDPNSQNNAALNPFWGVPSPSPTPSPNFKPTSITYGDFGLA